MTIVPLLPRYQEVQNQPSSQLHSHHRSILRSDTNLITYLTKPLFSVA